MFFIFSGAIVQLKNIVTRYFDKKYEVQNNRLRNRTWKQSQTMKRSVGIFSIKIVEKPASDENRAPSEMLEQKQLDASILLSANDI